MVVLKVSWCGVSLAWKAEVREACQAKPVDARDARGDDARLEHYFAVLDQGAARPGLADFLRRLCALRAAGTVDAVVLVTAGRDDRHGLRGYHRFVARLLGAWAAARIPLPQQGRAAGWLGPVFDHVVRQSSARGKHPRRPRSS